MDRSALSVAAPLVMKDLQLDAAQLGIVFSSFFAGYALFTLIGGYASDLFGPKRVFILSMSTWSVFCGLTAAAVGFWSLLVVRVLFGCGEGPFGAAASKMVSNWFPPRQIATAIGIANAGTPIGGALAGAVAGGLAVRYGWRTSFVLLAAIGLLWTLCCRSTNLGRLSRWHKPHELAPLFALQYAGGNYVGNPLWPGRLLPWR